MAGCRKIIGLDRVKSRLDMARSLGATDTIDTGAEGIDLETKIRELTAGAGASIVFDTTGVPQLLEAGLAFTANRGKMIIVGVPPPEFALSVHALTHLRTGRNLMGGIEGDVTPEDFVPKMIEWYHQGKLPIDKIIKSFKAEDFETALHEMHSGETIKPVLCW